MKRHPGAVKLDALEISCCKCSQGISKSRCQSIVARCFVDFDCQFHHSSTEDGKNLGEQFEVLEASFYEFLVNIWGRLHDSLYREVHFKMNGVLEVVKHLWLLMQAICKKVFVRVQLEIYIPP